MQTLKDLQNILKKIKRDMQSHLTQLTEKKGAVMSETAIGCGYIDFGGGNFMQMTQEREEVQAKTVLVANGYYAVAELVDLHGVEMHTEIS